MANPEERSRTLLAQARAQHQARRLDQAKELYRQSLQAMPTVEAWHGLGTIAADVGALDAAAQSFANAAALAGATPLAAAMLALKAEVLQRAGRLDDELACLTDVCRLVPGNAENWECLGIAQQALGDIAAAGESYRRAIVLGTRPGARLKATTLVSPVMESREAIAAERARVEAAIDELLARDDLRLDDPMATAPWPNFYLAFHGENDRALQVKHAEAYRRIFPSLEYVAAHCERPRRPGRLRVGLVSRFLHNHSIGRTSRGLFAQMDRAEFEVTALFLAPLVDDEYSRFIRAHAEHSLVVPAQLPEARRAIEALELDVLFYQDIGMEPFGGFLAYSRLARVQCVSYGHPDTTGIPAIDYWVSNDLYEPEGAEAHYSEKLFRLANLGTLAYYYRPDLPPAPRKRADFGLAETETIYLCPQNLFKFHPDMDELFAGILRSDPRGRLVVIEGRVPAWTTRLRQRWARTLPDVLERVRILPRLPSPDYVNLIALADVMLDTVHFNGMNTSLEAFSVGTPVVTLAVALQRGRHTQAMYRRMGLEDAIARDAAHYVELAVALGSDPDRRRAAHEALVERGSVLFEDARVVREFERFFREAAAKA
jgi:predicted O-linked N-acetylglucosamine transferase (SPINDLY family)